MGQKTNPIANRLGIIRGWDSNWFGGTNFEPKLVEDDKIRKYLNARLAKAGIAKIVIERTLKLVTVTIHTARPGIIIGKGGQEILIVGQALISIQEGRRARGLSLKIISLVCQSLAQVARIPGLENSIGSLDIILFRHGFFPHDETGACSGAHGG